MKKLISILAVMTCVFSLTACSGTTSSIEGEPMTTDEEAYWVSSGESMVESVQQIVSDGLAEDYADDKVVTAAVQSWENAIKDIGEVQGYQNEYAVYSDSKEISVNIGIDGSDHDANTVIVIDQSTGGYDLESITTNVSYSFGELMEQAALNTVLGMGTTFIVLILLAALIYLFRYIPGILDKFSKKEEEAPAAAPAAAAPAAPAATTASVDHDVLVAIQAAITAYENQA